MIDNTARLNSSASRKAYSYLRFSTPEQSKGDSKRRQWSMAVAYAAKHGLELDHELTFHDLGVSGYHGQNAEAGRLAYFLEAVRAGQVPAGSVLLVEHLDRISRLSPRRALRVLEAIVDLGVSVVTLNDERVYTAASMDRDPMDLFLSILTFTQANAESVKKAERLRASWEGKRAQVSTKPLTSITPAWLRLSDDLSQLEAIPERAELVQRVFKMTLEGVGQHKIAATFNEEGIAPWGRGKSRGEFWHRSYISKVLSNPAVIGTLQPHLTVYEGTRRRREPLDPVEGYFPAIISVEAFREAQALRQAHGAPQRGRHAHAPLTNMLAGLAVCSLCGSTMTRVNKGKRARPAYVCSKAKAGAGCAYHSIRCDRVEEAILRHLPELLDGLEGVEDGDVTDFELRGAVELVDRLKEDAADVADTLRKAKDATGEQSRTLALQLRDTEAELVEAEDALRSLLDRQQALTGATIAVRVQKALETLREPPESRSPAGINLALRRVFDRAVLLGTKTESEEAPGWRWWAVEMEWKHGGSCLVPLVGFGEVSGPGFTWQDVEECE